MNVNFKIIDIYYNTISDDLLFKKYIMKLSIMKYNDILRFQVKSE